MSVVMQLTQITINRLMAHNKVLFKSVQRCNGFHINSVTNNNETTANSIKTYVPVADFYNGKSVFVTGGTGFLGMVLVEKLLYTCTGIEKVFMLVREKKGVSPDQRMKQFFNNPLFQRLKEDKPTFLSKLVPVSGDVSAPNLDISDEDVKTLTEEVSIVFHSAASVRFNDKLSVPLKINFEGTMKILELSKKMKNIEMFVHISTAYANVTHYKDVVKEILYPPPATLEEVYELVAKYDNDKEMTAKNLNGSVNTYTFAKSLAEYYVAKNKEHVPLIIVRPAAVTAIADGPVPGWLSDWQGVTRALHNVGVGYTRVNPGSRDNVIDFIPVDYVVNLSIIAAAKSNGRNDLPIYNCCSSSVNPITWNRAFQWFTEDVVRRGQNELPFPFAVYADSKYLLWILNMLLHILPAHVSDMWLRMTGREPRFVQIQKSVMGLRKGMEFYQRYDSMMENKNVIKIIDSLSEKDRQLYPCNPAKLDWRKYMHVYSQGVDKFLVKKANK